MQETLRGKIAFSNDLYKNILNDEKYNILTYHHINILCFLLKKSSYEGGLKCSNMSLKELNEFLETKDNKYRIAKRVLIDLHNVELIVLPINESGQVILYKPSKKMTITLVEETDSFNSVGGFTYIPKTLISECPKSISIYLAIRTMHSKKYTKISYERLMERSFITGRREFDKYLNDLITNNFVEKRGCKGLKKEANSYRINDRNTKKKVKKLPMKINKKKIEEELLEDVW